jgi:hypothetical protein
MEEIKIVIKLDGEVIFETITKELEEIAKILDPLYSYLSLCG